MKSILKMARQAKAAAREMACLPLSLRNRALEEIQAQLWTRRDEIFAANQTDLAAAASLAAPLQKRLVFDADKLSETLEELASLTALSDPVGHTMLARELAPGLTLYQVSCPIGVVGVVFESRPDALVQIAALCLKSGNAVLLKGGREAFHTNRALFACITQAARSAGLPEGWAGLMETREDVSQMLGLYGLIDLIIPRGSNAFVQQIMQTSRIPVLGHADGLCAVYVDKDAALDTALSVTVDAKTQYMAVCNAAETLLVHQAVAPGFLPRLKAALDEKGVEIRGDDRVREIIDVPAASPADWDTEFLGPVLAAAVVPDIDAALAHIARHGSGHTDVIITENQAAASYFLSRVDSAGVFHNCSSRFADGFRYGFGAEVGISTGKLHARGPMGLAGLCTYQYKLLGSGQCVADFAQGKQAFTHRDLSQDYPL